MDSVRALIVDDERPARAKVRRLLAADPDVEVVGEAESGAEAIEQIRMLRPDLVFLDVQMPPPDGFGVLDALQGEPLPSIVFTTAYDEYAVRAFDVHALDYLLKPFDAERFGRALARAKQQLRQPGSDAIEERLRRLLDAAGDRPRAHLRRIPVQTRNGSVFVDVDSVDRVEAEQNYVRLHVGGTSYLVRGTLNGLERRLDPDRFVRIHRSHIVNLDRVARVHPWSHGDQLVVLHDGTKLMLSRRFRDRMPRLA